MSGNASAAAIFVENRDASGLAALQPRIRLLAALLLLVALPLLHQPRALLLAIATGIALVAVARLPVGTVLRRLAMVEGFLLVLLVTLPFTVGGQPLFRLGPLTASLDGAQLALIVLLRVNAAALIILALLGRMGAHDLGGALRGLGMPATIATLLQLTVRYLGTLADEYRRLRTAMRVRGFRARSNLHSWRSLGSLIGMVLVRSLERAGRVHRAMLCRGYAGQFPAPPQPPLRRIDLAVAAGATAFAVALVALDRLP